MNKDLSPLIPYKYPKKIALGGFLFALLALGSMFYNFHYIFAVQGFKKGKIAYESRSYEIAIECYDKCLEILPNSKQIKIALANAYFCIDKPNLAMNYLSGVTLNDQEWAELFQVMPEKFKQHFK